MEGLPFQETVDLDIYTHAALGVSRDSRYESLLLVVRRRPHEYTVYGLILLSSVKMSRIEEIPGLAVHDIPNLAWLNVTHGPLAQSCTAHISSGGQLRSGFLSS